VRTKDPKQKLAVYDIRITTTLSCRTRRLTRKFTLENNTDFTRIAEQRGSWNLD